MNTTEWVSPASNIIAEANKLVGEVNGYNAYQMTGAVLRYVARVIDVPASRLMGHAIITTDAAKLVEAYYGSKMRPEDIDRWNTDDIVEMASSIDWL